MRGSQRHAVRDGPFRQLHSEMPPNRLLLAVTTSACLTLAAPARSNGQANSPHAVGPSSTPEWCARLPRPEYAHLERVHVGDNWRFDNVLGMDDPFTKRNAAGVAHADIAGEVTPKSLGSRIDLGGRTLEIVQVPGHAPDATALLDRANGLIFTGDTFYEGPIYVFREGLRSRGVHSVDRAARGARAKSSKGPRIAQCGGVGPRAARQAARRGKSRQQRYRGRKARWRSRHLRVRPRLAGVSSELMMLKLG